MGADSQPFMYDHPSKYSFVGPSEKGFNPRAVSEATWRPSVPRPKMEGPLIQSKELNRHPDSYFVVPYGNLNWKPMSPWTKDKVEWTRYIQLLLRICSLLGAGGMLFCVICIKNTDAATGWIIRVPAGVAILHAIYAIYHLARSSRGRTPASSASYMLFAAIIDVSLVPFYVFAALMARAECTEPVGTPNSWQTLFNDSAITYKIVYSTFLICVTCGSLHLISLLLSLYLGVLFRKISRLPPDMNPLEDNLTSRHKRNKSSILENSNNQASMATSNSGLESEIDDPLISPRRSVPFMHTRNDSGSNLSEVPHPNASPRASRSDISTSLYGQPSSERNSRTIMSSILGHPPIQGPSNLTSRTHFPILTLPNRQPTIPDLTEKAQSRAQSTPGKQPPQDQQQTLNRSPTTSSSVYSTDTTTATNTTMNARSLSTVPSLPDNNWITHPSSSPSPSPSPPRELKNLGKKGAYQPLSQISPFEYTFNNENQPPYIRKHPLEMNPPTPVTKQWKRRATQNQQRALTPGNGNVKHHGNWNQGPGIVGIGKARAWRGMAQQVGRPNGDGRVVSRSGVEVRGGGILPNGGVRAREVSGKIMEEGRGTSNWDLIA